MINASLRHLSKFIFVGQFFQFHQTAWYKVSNNLIKYKQADFFGYMLLNFNQTIVHRCFTLQQITKHHRYLSGPTGW